MAQQDASAFSSSPVREDTGYHRFDHGRDDGFDRDQNWMHPGFDRRNDRFYQENARVSDSTNSASRDDPWSCAVVVLAFGAFASMTMMLGIYGSENIRLGPNSSFLIQPNPIFVQSIKVESESKTAGLKLYGFYKSPPLDTINTWSAVHYLAIPADSYKYWTYYLNEGSHINISYKVESPGASLYIVVAQDLETLALWSKDPANSKVTLSWSLVYGSGVIQQDIPKASTYYVGVGNVYLNEVKATVDIQARAILYNTAEAYYTCDFAQGSCNLNLLPKENSAVLTSPGPDQSNSKDDYSVKLSYGPRWISYVVCIGGITALILGISNYFKKSQPNHEDEITDLHGETGREDAPFLTSKDDLSSWCSSHGSILTSNENIDDIGNSNTGALCAICFDAPRDSFFLPCGHSVACVPCGTRITETSGICPVCRRKIKVRKIFTV